MRRFILATTTIASLLIVLPAVAETGGEADRSPERIATPPLGVRPTLRQGPYADLQVGAFFAVNLDRKIGRSVTNAQPYVGLALGYDITRNMVAGFGFGYGAAAGACFEQDPVNPAVCRGARSFSVILLNAHFGYLHALDHQWYLGAKVIGGAALMTPEPVVVSGGSMTFGYNAGLVLTTEYHTHLEHFVLGLDVASTFVIGGSQLQFPGFAIYPRLKYVF